MAIAKKEKEKKKAGSKRSRKSYLRSVAAKGGGGRAGTQYLKYGDVRPDKVHEGDATYRDVTRSDSGPLVPYAINVWRGYGKSYFIYKGPGTDPGGTLYKSQSGSNSEPIQT